MREIQKPGKKPRPLPDPLYIVTPNGCWEWQGNKTTKARKIRYGVCDPARFGFPELSSGTGGKGNQRRSYAHRVSYRQNTGPIPDGLVVRHLCDNGICVNPAHLVLGTQRENIEDIRRRHRPMGPAPADECKKCGADLRDPANVYLWNRKDGKVVRLCRMCRRRHGRENDARRKGRPYIRDGKLRRR